MYYETMKFLKTQLSSYTKKRICVQLSRTYPTMNDISPVPEAKFKQTVKYPLEQKVKL